MIRTAAAVALWGGAAATALLPMTAALVVSAGAREVLLLTPHSAEAVGLNRDLWSAGEPVADIYGIAGPRAYVLWPDPARIIVPPEDPSLTLLKIDERPLQVQTVWFFAGWAAVASAAVALLGAVLYSVTR